MLWSLILLLYCRGLVAAVKTPCGDTSIPFNKRCICAGEMLDTYFGPNHCCVNNSSDQQCYLDKNGANCPQGKVTKKTETCNNQCFNDYTSSENIGKYSHFHCGNNSCVPAWNMCRGYSMCEDRSDVSICGESLKCLPWRDRQKGQTDRRQMETGLSNNHSFCNYGDLTNDGQYNTITREDETNLDMGRQKLKIDISSSLTPCPYYNGIPGLKCGKLCVPNYKWCRDDISDSCAFPEGNFRTNNRAICGNRTVWTNKACDVFYSGGRKASLGRRCTGDVQQCSYPWYISSHYSYVVSVQLINI